MVLKMDNKTILQPKYDTRKSFYNKAYYTTEENSTKTIYKLYSYNTLVAIIEIDKTIEQYYNNKVIRLYLDYTKKDNKNFYSITTLRHVKEFIKQTTDNIRYQNNYTIVYYDNKKILHLYSIEILRKATKKDLFTYALRYETNLY